MIQSNIKSQSQLQSKSHQQKSSRTQVLRWRSDTDVTNGREISRRIAHRRKGLRHQQQRLRLLRHAATCPHENGQCPVTPLCAGMKSLWEHIAECKDKRCLVPHCLSSKYVLSHYERCKDAQCAVCSPVRKVIDQSNDRSKRILQAQEDEKNRQMYLHPPSPKQIISSEPNNTQSHIRSLSSCITITDPTASPTTVATIITTSTPTVINSNSFYSLQKKYSSGPVSNIIPPGIPTSIPAATVCAKTVPKVVASSQIGVVTQTATFSQDSCPVPPVQDTAGQNMLMSSLKIGHDLLPATHRNDAPKDNHTLTINLQIDASSRIPEIAPWSTMDNPFPSSIHQQLRRISWPSSGLDDMLWHQPRGRHQR